MFLDSEKTEEEGGREGGRGDVRLKEILGNIISSNDGDNSRVEESVE